MPAFQVGVVSYQLGLRLGGIVAMVEEVDALGADRCVAALDARQLEGNREVLQGSGQSGL